MRIGRPSWSRPTSQRSTKHIMMQRIAAACGALSATLLLACGQTHTNLIVELHLTSLDGNPVPLAGVPVSAFSYDPEAVTDSTQRVPAAATDTTDSNGVVWLRALPLGRWWVQAHYEGPTQVLIWNVSVEVTRGQPQVVLNRENAQVRPLQ